MQEGGVIVMKFGGSSVAGRAKMRRVARRVIWHEGPVVVVVSAMGGTTDALFRAAERAESGDWESCESQVEAIREEHHRATDDEGVRSEITVLLDELLSVLRGVYLLQESTPRSRALIASFGERLSAPIAAAWIAVEGGAARAVDARPLFRTDAHYDEAEVDLQATEAALRGALLPALDRGEIPVLTGFIGSTAEGITTTLGRGGSDYTAALVGGLLGAEEVWIWTDVDGIRTADPRLVREARRIDQVTYREAAEMSWFGAKVLHPRTMQPCQVRNIPIRIRSTLDPESPGTVVTDAGPAPTEAVQTVTSIRGLAMVTVDGRGMSGLPGIARRIFEVTEHSGVNVVMISQASSEQSVSLVVRSTEAAQLHAALGQALALERAAGVVEAITLQPHIAVVSIIGCGMAGRPGTAGRMFGALGQAGVNVLAIAQGAGELSISAALRDEDVVRGVRAVHTAFGLTRLVHLVVVGSGQVGRQLLSLLADHSPMLRRDRNLDLRLLGLVGRTRVLLDEEGLDPRTAPDRLAEGLDRPDDEALLTRILNLRLTDVVLVDVTASPLTALHRRALARGIHVVTANKLPLSGPMKEYRELVDARVEGRVRYGYETTFGAGLPVLHTLDELQATGDALQSVSGCFSGTLGYLCTRLQDGLSLAEAVREAEAKGYTEPDPREDLSGRDVARKALIIARSMGWIIEPEAVHLEAVIPDLDAGLQQALALHGPALTERVHEARGRGEVLRYVAEIAEGEVHVGLRSVPSDSPIGSLRGPDNLMVFQTRRYNDHPLVIRGPGAGAEVTAAGVLADILRIARPDPAAH